MPSPAPMLPTQIPATGYASSLLTSFHQLPDAIVVLSGGGTVQQVNTQCETLLNRKAAVLQDTYFRELFLPEDRLPVDSFLLHARETQSIQTAEFRVARSEGLICTISWSVYWSAAEDLFVGSGRDVSESVNARQSLLAKEQLFQALIDNSFDILALTDESGNYLYVSDTLTDSYGYSKGQLLGVNCFTLIHPEDLPNIQAKNSLLHAQKKVHVPPYRFLSATGEWVWTEAIVTNQLSHPGINGIVICARNIHQQFNTEKKLKEMQLLEALREGEEKERSRIARDLHDGISGLIAAAKMHFETMGNQSVAIHQLPGFQQGMELLQKASIAVRQTSHNLMPEILLENGLAEALQRYCANVSYDELKLAFFSLGTIRRLPSQFELSLYRIAQELIGNIIRHAKADEAIIQLSQHEAHLTLAIEDNGQGFTIGHHGSGTGLSSIRRRVAAMNGTMEIQSAPGKGTQVYLEFET